MEGGIPEVVNFDGLEDRLQALEESMSFNKTAGVANPYV